MASISKRVSGAWQNTNYGIRATATDNIIAFPAIIYGDGTNATVNIKGNTVQNGTPTPSRPVDVVGVGEIETSGEHSGQYKIPISSANTTTSVYLGEVQSTRKIKKLVLTGLEDWSEIPRASGYRFVLTLFPAAMVSDTTAGVKSCCSHLRLGLTGETYTANNTYTIANGSQLIATLGSNDRLANWKQFLANQHANGTPVIVWYVLVEPTTGIVNEPLQKIGEYADEVRGISIPTTDGANTLSVDTTVQPSEITATYHGWHMGTVHESTSGQWD